LPFHGQTDWKDGTLLPQELDVIIEEAFESVGLERESTFSLLAYSLGGRIALCLLQAIPQKIERVVLLAPDGLHVNFWYWLGTQTWAGNKLFYATMQNPGWFFTMTGLARKAGLLNKSIIKFVHHYLDDKEIRLLLYKRWRTLRKFRADLALARKNIACFKIPTRFVFGSYDRIILDKRSNVFRADEANVKVEIIQAGHDLLKEKHVVDIARQFSQ